mmetsp:Transcript_90376/g.179844  ORF Transcript_90376/g.179844 Transcript_90376/m.179844 type:complete len:239 (+) Transcript_90376:52-768(+)
MPATPPPLETLRKELGRALGEKLDKAETGLVGATASSSSTATAEEGDLSLSRRRCGYDVMCKSERPCSAGDSPEPSLPSLKTTPRHWDPWEEKVSISESGPTTLPSTETPSSMSIDPSFASMCSCSGTPAGSRAPTDVDFTFGPHACLGGSPFLASARDSRASIGLPDGELGSMLHGSLRPNSELGSMLHGSLRPDGELGLMLHGSLKLVEPVDDPPNGELRSTLNGSLMPLAFSKWN